MWVKFRFNKTPPAKKTFSGAQLIEEVLRVNFLLAPTGSGINTMPVAVRDTLCRKRLLVFFIKVFIQVSLKKLAVEVETTIMPEMPKNRTITICKSFYKYFCVPIRVYNTYKILFHKYRLRGTIKNNNKG